MGVAGSPPAPSRSQLLLDALAVALFAIVGMAMRHGIYLFFRGIDFGIVTTDAGGDLGGRCVKTSGASSFFMQNILGCALVAAVARHRETMHPSLATGLSTGLCGSLTTFGTWMKETSVATLNGEPWMACVGVMVTLSSCLLSFRFGDHVATCGIATKPAEEPEPCPAEMSEEDGEARDVAVREEDTSTTASWAGGARGSKASSEGDGEASSADDFERPGGRALWPDVAICVAAGLFLVVMATYFAVDKQDEALYALAWAPSGALLRMALSKGNWLTAPFPAFTLLANMLGSFATALAAVKQSHPSAAELAIDIWMAIGTGFGGCLSTVSTFVSELQSDKLGGLGLRTFYFMVSVGLAQLVILPTLAWWDCSGE